MHISTQFLYLFCVKWTPASQQPYMISGLEMCKWREKSVSLIFVHYSCLGHIHTHIYMHTYIHTHNIYIYIYIWYIYIYIHTYNIYTYIYIYIYIYTTHTHIYIYIHTYTYIHTGAGHIIRISSKSWFISLIPFKKWNLYNIYIHSTQTDIFQMFIYLNFDDYNWQLMKTPNSVSQKIWILLKTNTKIFRNLGQLKSMNMKSMSMYSTQYLVGAPFAWITAAMRRGMELISLWHCSGVMRAQVALIVAFSSSALLGLA